MKNVKKLYKSIEKCSENSCGEECYCFEKDNCKSGHLTKIEKLLLKLYGWLMYWKAMAFKGFVLKQ